MANNVNVTEGSGKTVSTEEIGGVQYQKIKVVGGETGSTSVLGVNPDRSISVSIIGIPTVNITGKSSVSGTVGASVIGTVPVTQSGTSSSSIQGVASVFQAGPWTTSVVGGPISLYAPTSSYITGVTSVITGTTSVQVLAPAPGGQRNHITQLLVTNAANGGTTVSFYDGGNVIYSGYAAANGGGFALTFPVPLRQASVAGNLSVLTSAQASVLVSASGFTAA